MPSQIMSGLSTNASTPLFQSTLLNVPSVFTPDSVPSARRRYDPPMTEPVLGGWNDGRLVLFEVSTQPAGVLAATACAWPYMSIAVIAGSEADDSTSYCML